MSALLPLVEQLAWGQLGAAVALRPLPKARFGVVELAEWIAGGEVCPPSKSLLVSLAARAAPASPRKRTGPFSFRGAPCPRDAASFRRCLVLIHRFPELREGLSSMSAQGESWARLVEHWDALEDTFLAVAAEGAARRIAVGERLFGDADGAAQAEAPWWSPAWPHNGHAPAPDATSVMIEEVLGGCAMPDPVRCRRLADLRQRGDREARRQDLENQMEALLSDLRRKVGRGAQNQPRSGEAALIRLRNLAYSAALMGIDIPFEGKLEAIAESIQ